MPTPIEQMNLGPADFVRGAVEAEESGGEWTFRRFAAGQAAAYREAGNDDFYQKTFADTASRPGAPATRASRMERSRCRSRSSASAGSTSRASTPGR